MSGRKSRPKAGVILFTGVALFILFTGYVIPDLSAGWRQTWAGMLLVAVGAALVLLLGRGATLRCDRAQNICTLTERPSLAGRGSVQSFRLENLRGARVYERSDYDDSVHYEVALETRDGPVFTSAGSKSRADATAKRINKFVHSRAPGPLVVRRYSRTVMLAGGFCIAFGAYLILRAALG